MSFTRELKKGVPSGFKDKIERGWKRHTFRLGKRWRPGLKIDTWMGSPRNIHNAKIKPEKFWIPEYRCNSLITTLGDILYRKNKEQPYLISVVPACYGVEDFYMDFRFRKGKVVVDQVPLNLTEDGELYCVEGQLVIGGIYDYQFSYLWNRKKKSVSLLASADDKLISIAYNDGLDIFEFFEWFTPKKIEDDFMRVEGQIIHWTENLYHPDKAKTIFTEKLV